MGLVNPDGKDNPLKPLLRWFNSPSLYAVIIT
jgi:hypothetical protein